MNTLSSLLKFIGDKIGADPSTLVTSNKTLVGAINEAVGAAPSTLTTTSKTLVGAINEIDSDIETLVVVRKVVVELGELAANVWGSQSFDVPVIAGKQLIAITPVSNDQAVQMCICQLNTTTWASAKVAYRNNFGGAAGGIKATILCAYA